VQGLKQEGDCESRVLSSQFLITNSRLGELYFKYVNFMMCVVVLCHCLLDWNMIVVNSCMYN